MDNHAGNLQWFAGFVDADGCIGLHKQVLRSKVTWVPEFSVTTTCTKTANHIQRQFDAMDLPIYRTLRKVTKPNWTDRHQLIVRGMKRVMVVLPLLMPYLVTKRQEGELLIQFIASRRSQIKGTPYTPEELDMVAQCKALKRSRHK